MATDLKEMYKQSEKEFHKSFYTFLRFKSISSESAYKKECLDCVRWLQDYIQKIGFKTELWPTTGHPVLYAHHLEAGPTKPTLLIYNHYDVQPDDPVDLWESPPFEPTVRNGEIYARGAQDNKGQCFYTLHALKMLLARDKKLPVNVKLCIEGEEECGSVSLPDLLKQKEKELKADYLAIVDMGIPKRDTPAVTLGVRGIVTMDVEVVGPNTDLHSGSHGGVVMNPIHVLIELLHKLHDVNGKVAIPGFYDSIVEMTPEDKKQISFEFDPHHYEKVFGVPPKGGEAGYSPMERAWLRPTIEINGITGGYSGSGFKTVIPSKASAKVSCRLIPKMDPQKIGALVTQFLRDQAPEGVRVHVKIHPGGGRAARANPNSSIVKAFAEAYQEIFKKPCQRIFSGGSIPIATNLAEAAKAEMVLMGLGLEDDKIHAPNEHFGIDRLEKGFLIIARTLEILGNKEE